MTDLQETYEKYLSVCKINKKELKEAEKELKIVSKLCNELFHVNNYHRIKNNL